METKADKAERRKEIIQRFMLAVDRAKFGGVVALRNGEQGAIENTRVRLQEAVALFEKQAEEVAGDPA